MIGPSDPKHAPGLLERDGERERLAAWLADALVGHGHTVLVSGEPGIGKTALLGWAQERAEADGAMLLRARGTELEQEFAFGVVRQLLERAILGLQPAERTDVLSGPARPASALLGLSDSPEPDSENHAFAVVHGLYALVANLADRGPLVLVVDDLHWADAPSLRWLTYLAGRIHGLSALVLVAVRALDPAAADGDVANIVAEPGTELIALGPLSAEASAVLVERQLGASGAPEFNAACHSATGGNPFFLGELCRELRTEGVAPSADGAARVADRGPATVARSVLLRTARLSAAAVALARALAILGADVELAHAAALAGIDMSAAGAAAAGLASAQVIVREQRLSFLHPIVGSSIYAEIPADERARAHREAARILAGSGAAPEQISAHLLSAAPAQDEWTVEVLERASVGALERGAPDSAVAYLQRALAEPPNAGDRHRILEQLGWAEYLAHRRSDAVAHLRQAIRMSPDTDNPGILALRTSRVLVVAGVDRSEEAVELLDEVIPRVAEADSALRMRLEAQLLGAAGLKLATRPLHRRLLDVLATRRFGDGHVEQTLLAVVVAWTTLEGRVPGRFPQLAARDGIAGTPAQVVQALIEQALSDGRMLDEEGPESEQFYNAISALWLIGSFERAAYWLDRAIAVAQARGSVVGFALGSAFSAEVAYRIGDLSSAEAHARAAMEFAPGDVTAVLANTLIEHGKLAEAAATLDRQPLDGGADHLLLQPVAAARARLHLARGESERGAADLSAVGAWLDRWPVLNPGFIAWRSALAGCLAGTGDRERARELATTEVQQARSLGQAAATGVALRSAALVEGRADGIDLLRDAVAALEGSGARLEHARTLVHLGAALRRAGLRREAREPLRQALDAAHRCTAGALAAHARTELLATGARPRRQVVSGRDSLTPTERRIAGLAAGGQTTREIANGLFVTVKTVETHLGHIYQKLDIHSRRELPAALGLMA